MKKLVFGQTPWDFLSLDRLRRIQKRMRSVLEIAQSHFDFALSLIEKNPVFFGPIGRGGKNVERIKQALARANKIDKTSERKDLLLSIYTLYRGLRSAQDLGDCYGQTTAKWYVNLEHACGVTSKSREFLYRNFFCVVEGLLFDSSVIKIVEGPMMVCPACDNCFSNLTARAGHVHKHVSLSNPDCEGVLRAYTWTDLHRPDLEA